VVLPSLPFVCLHCGKEAKTLGCLQSTPCPEDQNLFFSHHFGAKNRHTSDLAGSECPWEADMSMGSVDVATHTMNKADHRHFLIVGLQIQIQHLVKKMVYTAPRSLDSKPAFKSPQL
jgi:hypothetical protein